MPPRRRMEVGSIIRIAVGAVCLLYALYCLATGKFWNRQTFGFTPKGEHTRVWLLNIALGVVVGGWMVVWGILAISSESDPE